MNPLQIHALPTEGESNICLDTSCNEFNYFEPKSKSTKHTICHYIYLTDDSPIKEGDWCLHKVTGKLLQYDSNKHRLSENWKKIIATTDPKFHIIDTDKCKCPTVKHRESCPELTCRAFIHLISQADLPKIAEALNNGVTSVGVQVVGRECNNDVYSCGEAMCCETPFIMAAQKNPKMKVEIGRPKTKDGCIVLDWGDPIYCDGCQNPKKQCLCDRPSRQEQQVNSCIQVAKSRISDWRQGYTKSAEAMIEGVEELLDKHLERKEKMYTKEEVDNKLYECLGFFAHKHDIVIDGRDLTKWIKDNSTDTPPKVEKNFCECKTHDVSMKSYGFCETCGKQFN